MQLSLTGPSPYFVVSRAVEQFNETSETKLDPISVADALVAKGYKINFIPKRKIDIAPTEHGLILDVAQIRQILEDDRSSDFRILDVAIKVIVSLPMWSRDSLKDQLEDLGQRLVQLSYGESRTQDPHEAAKGYMLRQAMSELSRRENAGPDAEHATIAPHIVEQAVFILNSFDDAGQLLTKAQKRSVERRHETLREEERQSRVSRRNELFESKDATERWLFGAARGDLKEAGRKVEDAAMRFASSKQAAELIKHHAIDLFDFTDRQIAKVAAQGKLRREIGWIEGPLAVLLTAFAKPRVVADSPQTIRNDPGAHVYRVVSRWLGARFVKELPDGAYADALESERKYQERSHHRSLDRMAGSSLFGFRHEERDEFYQEVLKDEREQSARQLEGYESSRVATLWWVLPPWKKWEILRRPIERELRDVARLVQGGYTAKQFTSHIDRLVDEENERKRRVLKLQDVELSDEKITDEKSLAEMLKELMEKGTLSERRDPSEIRADAVITACNDRIRDLTEMRHEVHFHLVMSREQREAERERRQSRLRRWDLLTFR